MDPETAKKALEARRNALENRPVDTGKVNFPEKPSGENSPTETITSIAPESNNPEVVKPVSEQSELELSTEESLKELDFIIGDILDINANQKTPQQLEESIRRLGDLITDLPTFNTILGDSKIANETKINLNDRYERIKSGLGEVIYQKREADMGFFTPEQKRLLKEIGDRFVQKM